MGNIFIYTTQPIPIEDGTWLIRLTSLEVRISIFNVTQENQNFEIYQSLEWNSMDSMLGSEPEISCILSFSDFLTDDLQDQITGPLLTETYKKLLVEKKSMMVGQFCNWVMVDLFCYTLKGS